MNIEFTAPAWDEYQYWQDHDQETALKIRELLRAIRQDPFKGLGKPEPLKNDLKGFWSRRINQEHRLVYTVTGTRGIDQKCVIIQCRFHY
jgi:toxin YoeB